MTETRRHSLVQRDINESYLKVCGERNELRAEVERLRSWSKAAQEAFERGHRLEDEIERLRAEAQTQYGRGWDMAWEAGQKELERLRAEVRGLTETIEDWQQTHGTFTANAIAIQIEDECDADD